MRCWLLVTLSLGCGKGEGRSVGNSPPSTPGIELSPAQPNASDDLKVTITADAEDPDGDNVEYKIEWLVDGEVVEGADALTLDKAFTLRGERWSVIVTAFDGIQDGGRAGASVDILNAAPTVANIRVTPTEPTVSDTISCSYDEPEDLDYDEIQELQVWAINGEEIDVRGPITSEVFVKHDQVECLVYADDGVADLEPHRSDVVTVLNTLPNVIGCSLATNNPPDNVPLAVTSEGFYDLDGDPEGYLYAWFINGEEVSSDETLAPSLMSPGDNVYVECTAWDGEEAGNTVTSGQGTVIDG